MTRPDKKIPFLSLTINLNFLVVITLCSLVLGNILRNFEFLVETNNRNTYQGRMGIDSGTYVENARRMIEKGEYFFTPNSYHSSGMQVYLSFIFRLIPNESFQVFVAKFLNLLYWIIGLFVFFLICKKIFHNNIYAILSTYLLSSSNLIQKYCSIVQYEIPVMLLLLLSLYLFVFYSHHSKAQLLNGIILAIATLFRPHFIIVWILGGGYFLARILIQKHGNHKNGPPYQLKTLICFLSGFIIIVMPWNAFYALHKDKTVLSQVDVIHHIGKNLNPYSEGRSPPYAMGACPSGINFIIHRPYLYLKYLNKKWKYLFGLEPDLWHVESHFVMLLHRVSGLSIEVLRKLFGMSFILLFLTGLIIGTRQLNRKGNSNSHLYLVFYPIAVLAPQLIVISSTRYLLPVMPMIFLIQLLTPWFLLQYLLANVVPSKMPILKGAHCLEKAMKLLINLRPASRKLL